MSESGQDPNAFSASHLGFRRVQTLVGENANAIRCSSRRIWLTKLAGPSIELMPDCG
jgi:hypothetical protein